MFIIEDGRKQFYQWDISRRLIIEDGAITQVHFCNRTDNCSLVVEVYEEDSRHYADVPNILLQNDWDIRVYAYDGEHTKHSEVFKVVKRSKPADYIYTETELVDWHKVEDKVEKLLEPLVLTGVEVDVPNERYHFEIRGAKFEEIEAHSNKGGAVILNCNYMRLPLTRIITTSSYKSIVFSATTLGDAPKLNPYQYTSTTQEVDRVEEYGWVMRSDKGNYAYWYINNYEPSKLGYIKNDVSDLQNYYTKAQTTTAAQEASKSQTVSGILKIKQSDWHNDALEGVQNLTQKPMRMRFYKEEKPSNLLAKVLFNESETFNVTSSWTNFTGYFTLTADAKILCTRLYGGGVDTYIQPYDIANIEIYRYNKTTGKKIGENLISTDIAKLNWWQYESLDDRNRLAVSFADGEKYLHVFRQYHPVGVEGGGNTSGAAWNSMTNVQGGVFPAGDYVITFKARTTTTHYYCTLPLEGIRDSSATYITPMNTYSADICEDYNIKGISQRIGEITFCAGATKPTHNVELKIGVSATRGMGGLMVNLKG